MRRVKRIDGRANRSRLFTVSIIATGIIIVLAVFVLAIPSLTRSGKIESRLGPSTFDAGSATKRARTIADAGPLLFSDVTSGDRDIWLQHTGSSAAEGWLAFDARKPGTGRECTLTWDPDNSVFEDPCTGTEVSADGAGLVHYDVTVNDDEHVIIDLRSGDGSSEGSDQAP